MPSLPGAKRSAVRPLARAERTHRFVNNNDIVPHLPPEPVYTHTQLLRYLDSTGKLRESMPLLGGLTDARTGDNRHKGSPGRVAAG
ncbi:hypothetical protein [Streptomyces cyaneochromogenes]|uniref:hypothetical protein n=1 Tax=Streptomyces cyaneochromogenes TaxID=2496836 RepID=UPI0015893F8C|nr:hypothetical protein [Streptomyces cyaneochromogenes]